MKERNLDRKDRNDRKSCDRKPNRYLEILHGKRCQARKKTQAKHASKYRRSTRQKKGEPV